MSKKVIVVAVLAGTFAVGVLDVVRELEWVSGPVKLLLGGVVMMVPLTLSWLAEQRNRAAGGPGAEQPAVIPDGPAEVIDQPPVAATVPRLIYWTAAAYVFAAVVGAYWFIAKVLTVAVDLLGIDLPGTLGDLDPLSPARAPELFARVSIIFAIAHALSALAMLNLREQAPRWQASGMAQGGATISVFAHVLATLLWVGGAFQLDILPPVMVISYVAIMFTVILGRCMTMSSPRPRGFLDWLTFGIFGIIAPAIQILEVLSWLLFGSWVKRRLAP